MKTAYIEQNGKKIYTQVSDELYEEMKRLRREEWRNDYNFKSKFYSIDERMELGLDTPNDSQNPEALLIGEIDKSYRSAQYKKLKQALKALTEKQRDSIYMHFALDMPYSEMASDSGVSKQAIEQSVHSALKKLRKSF